MINKQISDYAWLAKTQRSWHLWIGNPFCVSKQIIPLKKAEELNLIKFAKKINAKEKKRFTKKFKNVKWVSLN